MQYVFGEQTDMKLVFGMVSKISSRKAEDQRYISFISDDERTV